MSREEVLAKIEKAKSIENEFLAMASEEKFLNEFISKIICSYLYVRFDNGELDVLAKAFFKEELEDGFRTEEEAGVDELFSNIACAVDCLPLDEAIKELTSVKEFKDCWRV